MENDDKKHLVFPNYTANLHHSSETRVTYVCTINVAYLQEENMKILKIHKFSGEMSLVCIHFSEPCVGLPSTINNNDYSKVTHNSHNSSEL